mgnify:CR=1 FL=1
MHENEKSLYESVDYNRNEYIRFVLNSDLNENVRENGGGAAAAADASSSSSMSFDKVKRLVKRQTIEANNILLKSQPIRSFSEDDSSDGFCYYSNIRSKITNCFQNSNDCK